MEKCAVVRKLVKQKSRLQQILAAQDRQIKVLKRTQVRGWLNSLRIVRWISCVQRQLLKQVLTSLGMR